MPLPKAENPAGKPAAGKSERKPWKKKTPVEVFLDQEDKLKKEIAEVEADLKTRRQQLAKFEQVRKIFEAS